MKLTAVLASYDGTVNYRQTVHAFSDSTRLTREADEFSNLPWLRNTFVRELDTKHLLLTARNDSYGWNGSNDLIHLKKLDRHLQE